MKKMFLYPEALFFFLPVLNLFCEQGMSSLEACTPWFLLQRSLENDRYKIMRDKLIEEIQI